MRSIFGFVPLLLLVAGAVAGARRLGGRPRRPFLGDGDGDRAPLAPGAPGSGAARTERGGDDALAALLDRRVADGTITAAQRAALLEPSVPAGLSPSARPRRAAAVAEAVGYLGGMLAVSGLGLIGARTWPDLSSTGRLAVSGLAALALLGAGSAAPEHREPALTRLRWFLWAAGTAAAAVFAGVAAQAGDRAELTVAMAAAATGAAVSGALWRGRDRPVQELLFLAGLATAAGTAVAQVALEGTTGVVVWSIGAAYLLVGVRRLVPGPAVATAAGAGTVLAGGLLMSIGWTGTGLLAFTATAFALVALGSAAGVVLDRAERLLVLALGLVVFVQAAPAAIAWYAKGAGALTGLAVWLWGGLVLYAGLRQATRAPGITELAGGSAALVGAAVVAAQQVGPALALGIATAVALVALGAHRGEARLSGLGALGLLVDVPWAIRHFFPGEGSVPVAAVATGALLVAIAIWLGRRGRSDVGPSAPIAHA